MNFLALSAFAFLALAPVIVFLYFLKLRRQEHVISTVMLWRRSIDDLRANAPFQRLRRNLLLLLQLLVVTVLVLALARPYVSASPVRGRSVVLLIDNSASMNVSDCGGMTRLERAKELAREVVGQVRAGRLAGPAGTGVARAMVVSFGGRTAIRCGFSDNRSALNNAIDSIRPTDTGTSLREALAVAFGVAGGVASPEILVLSDGAFPAVESAQPDAGKVVAVGYVMVGSRGDNAGIVSLKVRRQIEGGRGFEVFVALYNGGDADLNTTLDLYLNDRLLDVRHVRASAKGQAAAVFRHYRDDPGVLKVKFDAADALAADNVAYAVLGEERTVKALLVSDGNFFLEKALALNPAVEVSRMSPSKLADDPPAPYDLVVFDGCAPRRMGRGGFLFVTAIPPGVGVERGPAVERPALIDWDPTHSVTRFINFEPLYVLRAVAPKLPSAFQVLLESSAGPLLAALETGEFRLLYLGFDPCESTWPFRVSFPIFMTNATRWLAGTGGESEEVGRTGCPVALALPAATSRAAVVDPRGEAHVLRLEPGGKAGFPDADWVGVYRVVWPGQAKEAHRCFAANLMDAGESDVRPRDHVRVEGANIPAAPAAVVQREVWGYLLSAALFLILLEWAVYHRRIWV